MSGKPERPHENADDSSQLMEWVREVLRNGATADIKIILDNEFGLFVHKGKENNNLQIFFIGTTIQNMTIKINSDNNFTNSDGNQLGLVNVKTENSDAHT